MNKLEPYKGYAAQAEIDTVAGVLTGKVVGLKDVIHFEGRSVAELVSAFHAAVDEYLAWCAESGDQPERPFSGKVMVRMDPDLHRRLAARAEHDDTSINSVVVRAVEEHLARSGGSAVPARLGTGPATPPRGALGR